MGSLNLTPFTAEEPRRRATPYETRRTYAPRDGQGGRDGMRGMRGMHGKRRVNASSMMAKILICLGILAAVAIGQAVLLNDTNQVVETAGSESDGGDESGDVLGRLRYVSAGGVRSVFRVSQRWESPVEHAKAVLEKDDTLLTLTGTPGEKVSLAAEGVVEGISEDASYGAYVRIDHGNDLESIYYHLTDIRVEKGQPLSAGDTLGKLGEDGKLYLSLQRAGAPLNPTAYFDLQEQETAGE